jgi:acylglycerol lipase
MVRKILVLSLCVMLGACATVQAPTATAHQAPRLEDSLLMARDGLALPLRHWDAQGAPRAVIVALHGMSDYSNAFDGPAKQWAALGITTMAFDQRGFGSGVNIGSWSGSAAMRDDLADAVAAAKAKYPGVPVFALGGHPVGVGAA